MTPLEKARQQKQNGGCDTCANRVIIDGVNYCSISGKFLLPSKINCDKCMHNPSDYKRSKQ